jgi:putative inorganic carbon (hco3(-)) transporter
MKPATAIQSSPAGAVVPPGFPAGTKRAFDPPAPLALGGVLFLAYLATITIEYLGLAQEIPFLRAFRASTLLAWGTFAAVLVQLGPRILVEFTQSRLMLAFVIFSGITVFWAVVQSFVPTQFRYHWDYFALFLVTLYVVNTPARLKRLALVCAAISIILVVRNLEKLGDVRVGGFRAGYFLGDGNDFAWGLLSLMVFGLFLALGRNGLLLRSVGLGAVVAAVLGVVGSGSRGAGLALAAGVLYYWLAVSRRRILGIVVLAVLVVGVVTLAPGGYLDRMQTIQQYEDDGSAQARITAWKAAYAMAFDFPLGVGAGNFNSAYGRYYMPEGDGWGARRWISAHSVYFKVLGEYGFLGLILWLSILGTTIRDNHRTLRTIRADPARSPISPLWPGFLNFSLVAYAVAGAFLGGVAYPHLFILAGLTLSCRRLVESAMGNGPAEGSGEKQSVATPSAPRGTPTAPEADTSERSTRGGQRAALRLLPKGAGVR